MNAPDTDAAGVLSTATLFHKRRMRVRLVGLKLLDDREKDNVFDFSEAGDPPAEITVEEEVRYDPYVKDKLGKSVLVHEAKIEHRSAAPLWQQAEGPFKAVDVQVFEAPVFDEMQAIDAKFMVRGVDIYPRFDVLEAVPLVGDVEQGLVVHIGPVPITDGHEWTVKSKDAEATFRVDVFELY
jgi:hypothetical protein